MRFIYFFILSIVFFSCTKTSENTDNPSTDNIIDINNKDEANSSTTTVIAKGIEKPNLTGDPIKDIKEKFRVINDAVIKGYLTKDSMVYECPDYPEGGVLSFYKDKNDIRMMERNYYAGDHGGETVQYYVWDDELFFQFNDQSYWMFDASNMSNDEMNPNTVDYFTEMRYYFNDGELIKCLEKKFEYKTANKKNPKSNEVSNREVACKNAKEKLADFQTLMNLEGKAFAKGDCIWDFIDSKQ